MDGTDTIPSFIVFAFQGCFAPSLLGDGWAEQDVTHAVRPVTIPLILMCVAALAMLTAFGAWWREMTKSLPLAFIGIAFICVTGFLGYQANDIYQNAPNFAGFLTGGNYFIAVGEFSLYLLSVFMMVLVSFILVARESGWETERNLLILATGGTVAMTGFWVMISFAVWRCV